MQYHFAVPAKVFADGHVSGAAVLESVGARLRNNDAIRLTSISFAELDLWSRDVLWTSYAPDRACFRFIDYQGTGDDYADGHSAATAHASYTGVQVALDTGSGAHYVATPEIKVDNLSFRYDSLYTGENGFQSWVPATSYYEHSVVNACFTTTHPLAEEHTVSWSMTDAYQRWIMHFDFAIEGGGATLTSSPPEPSADAPSAPTAAPSSSPPPPPPPVSSSTNGASGRYEGDATSTIALRTTPSTAPRTGTSRARVDLIEEGDTLTLDFNHGCTLHAHRKGPHATTASIVSGQTCTFNEGVSEAKVRITHGKLTLSGTELQISYAADMTVTQHVGGKSATAPGTMSVTLTAHRR